MRGARRKEVLAQVVPPGQRQAGRVEREVDGERQVRPAGGGDRRAEAARDQVAAASADRAAEAERGGALDAGGLDLSHPSGDTRTFRLPPSSPVSDITYRL